MASSLPSHPSAAAARGREFDTGDDSSRDAALPQQHLSDDDDFYDDDGTESVQPQGDHHDYETGEEGHHPDSEVRNESPATSLPPDLSSIASASFGQLQEQMLRLFNAAQSQAKELEQRVNELEEEKWEIVPEGEGKEAYEVREARLLSRIEELIHENRRLSGEISCNEQDESYDELLRENAELVAQLAATRKSWTVELSAISEERAEERVYLHRLYREEITSIEDALLTAMSNEDHATTQALRAQHADLGNRPEYLQKSIFLKGKKSALDSEFKKFFEEQEHIANSTAAGMQQTVSLLRQQVVELERSHSTVEAKYSRRENREHGLESALVGIDRLQGLLEEHELAMANQKHILDAYHDLQRPAFLLDDSEFSMPKPKNHTTPANELAKTPTIPPSVTEESLKGKATCAASENQLEVLTQATNELENQHPTEKQIPAQATPPESEFNDLEKKNAALEEELETLRRQHETLQEDHALTQALDKKWRKHFEHFMHGAAEVQRKDASKHQIKKGFKNLHKIVKEGELQRV